MTTASPTARAHLFAWQQIQPWLEHRAKPDGDGCLVWHRCVSRGEPMARMGDKTTLVRRHLYQACRGPIPAGHVVRCSCASPLCVLPAHLVTRPRNKLKGQPMTQRHRAAIAAAKRAKSLLAAADVQAIRQSDEPPAALAARYSVHPSYISHIRRHRAWRDYSNPFAALMRATK